MTHAPEPSGFLSDRSSGHHPWHWRFHDAAGAELAADAVPGGGTHFPSQGDAETWVGEVWRELLEHGVDAVTLLDGERAVYGPMGLRPV